MGFRYLTIVGLLAGFVLAGFTVSDTRNVAQRLDEVAAEADEPASWNVDLAHSRIGFRVKHLGISNVEGRFRDYDVTLTFDPNDFSTLQTTAVIDVASIDTEVERRDNHLRSPDFFDAENYPEMKFVSKEVRNVEGNTFELVGDLTIRDTTKEVVLDVEYLGSAVVQGSERAAFSAQTSINRKEFGLMWDRLTEAGGLVVGHDVTILLDLEVIRQ